MIVTGMFRMARPGGRYELGSAMVRFMGRDGARVLAMIVMRMR